MPKKETVILDTDIGCDIDDTWALGMLLNSPELDLKLLLTCAGNTVYRARLAAKFLSLTGHDDIAIGIGPQCRSGELIESLAEWLGDYHLEGYRGAVYHDGLERAIEIIESEDRVTIIGIGPMTNLAEICRRRPDLISKCRLVAMVGSIQKAYQNVIGVVAEYNVRSNIEAAQMVFEAPWREFVITPLDHCGHIILDGDDYAEIAESAELVPRYIIENYHAWLRFHGDFNDKYRSRSSVLFDTAAVYLAYTVDNTETALLPLIVNDEGYVLISDRGMPVKTALRWRDFAAYRKHLVERLTVASNKSGTNLELEKLALII